MIFIYLAAWLVMGITLVHAGVMPTTWEYWVIYIAVAVIAITNGLIKH